MLSLSCCAAGVSLRKFLPIPTNSRVFPTLSSTALLKMVLDAGYYDKLYLAPQQIDAQKLNFKLNISYLK
jgi:hypothetical protein